MLDVLAEIPGRDQTYSAELAVLPLDAAVIAKLPAFVRRDVPLA